MHKILIVSIFIFTLLQCSTPSLQPKDGVVVTDMLGREVMVPRHISRVVALRAGALRLLTYMDAVSLISGVEDSEKRLEKTYTMAYPELLHKQSIGPAMGGDAELILKSNADVIFISYTTVGDADALQKKTGIPVVAIECPEFAKEKDVLFDSFKLIGSVLNKKQRADSLIHFIDASINELNTRTKHLSSVKNPALYIGGVGYSGSYGINSTQPYYPPFIFANAKNVAQNIDEKLISHVKGTFVDKEILLEWNPDYIFIDESGLQIVNANFHNDAVIYQNLKAFKNNNVFSLLPYNNYAINYELVLINAWYVAKVLYPEKFSDVNIAAKTSEILEGFYNTKVDAIIYSKKLKRIEFENL